MEERSSPLIPQLVLWIAFALLVVASVLTVLVPALTSEGPDEEEDTAETAPEEG